MKKSFGFIGGSGLYKLDGVKVLDEILVDTPFGSPSDKVLKLSLDGDEFYFLPRHGKSHSISPSDLNYRANIYALKSLGVEVLISVSAVGSLKEEHAPTNFVLVDQFIDWTKGLRKRTFFENGVVGHVSCAYPVNKNLQDRIAKVMGQTEIKHSKNGTYVCIEGPQFSSRAESELYRSFGADVIGMTNVPEAYLAKEAGMAYATVAMVTDYDCWKEEHCTVEEIMKVMGQNNQSAQTLTKLLVPSLSSDPIQFEKENAFAVVTDPEVINKENQEIIKVLQS
ncbi:MAG: S-methyl-5'-thioadenosine phosphorylase [Halobacteriovoraceae bacterium]|nr:S-methyl-5'-thioadenosine phosphorylase [Halobacteriovoraceae bacterium]|tara:strand:+ start:48618 stop:49460 length:843 start_codon:yes stop_codon:yes gene_type:complete